MKSVMLLRMLLPEGGAEHEIRLCVRFQVL